MHRAHFRCLPVTRAAGIVDQEITCGSEPGREVHFQGGAQRLFPLMKKKKGEASGVAGYVKRNRSCMLWVVRPFCSVSFSVCLKSVSWPFLDVR